jgi:hypothetical protein
MWTTRGEQWRLTSGAMEASFDVEKAAGGLFDIQVAEQPLPNVRLLQCENASAGAELDSLVDHYVREDDLVATYLQSPARVNRKQIYIRPAGFLYSEPVTGVELVFSMQTQRLDADPQLMIRSLISSSEIYALKNNANPTWEPIPVPEDALEFSSDHYCGAFAAKLADTDITFAQILDPADFTNCRLIRMTEDADQFAISQPVFCTSLEKGVIRRGRVTALFMLGEGALEVAARFFDWYRRSPPQLTT